MLLVCEIEIVCVCEYVCVCMYVCVCVYVCVSICGCVATCTNQTTKLQILMSLFLKWAHVNPSITMCVLYLIKVSKSFFDTSVLTCHLS